MPNFNAIKSTFNSGGIPVDINERYALDPDGFIIDKFRPALNNPDGSQSTEISSTIGRGNRHFNIPTVVNGRRVLLPMAIMDADMDMRLGNTPNFNSLEEALFAAPGRSGSIGSVRGLDNSFFNRSDHMNAIFRALMR